MWCVVHPSGYPVSVFKDLYNKLLTKRTVGEVFGAGFFFIHKMVIA
jgi:hypothetical protein